MLVTAGATEAIAATLLALCEPGDEVVTFEPYYDSYAACIAHRRRPAPRRAAAHARLLVRRRRARATRSRPARACSCSTRRTTRPARCSRVEELELIARLCVEHDLVAVTDEVYEHLVFDGEHVPLATLPGHARPHGHRSRREARRSRARAGRSAGSARRPTSSTAVRTVKQFLTYVNGGPFQYGVAAGLGLPGLGVPTRRRRPRGEARPAVGRPRRRRAHRVPVGRHLLRHRRHPLAGGARRARVLPLASRSAAGWSPSRASCSTTTRTRAARSCASRAASASTVIDDAVDAPAGARPVKVAGDPARHRVGGPRRQLRASRRRDRRGRRAAAPTSSCSPRCTRPGSRWRHRAHRRAVRRPERAVPRRRRPRPHGVWVCGSAPEVQRRRRRCRRTR